MSATTWAPPSPAAKYGPALAPGGPRITADTELSAVSSPAAGETGSPFSPANPLFWFGAIAALTFGLMAVSTSVRVGPAKAAVSLGKS